MKDFVKLIDECREDLASVGIQRGTVLKWKINARAMVRWGMYRMITEGMFEISIAQCLSEDEVDDQAAKDAIGHELLHTIPGCLKHTGKWKLLADRVNNLLPQYTIKRTATIEEKGVSGPIKTPTCYYAVQCVICGGMAYRQRMSKVIKHPEYYRCAQCGGKLKRLEY